MFPLPNYKRAKVHVQTILLHFIPLLLQLAVRPQLCFQSILPAETSKYTTVHINIGFGCNLAILIAKQVSLTHHLMGLNPFVRKPFYQAIKTPKSCLLPRNEDSTPFSQDLCSVHGQTFLSQVLSTWQLLSQDSMACALYILHMLCKQFGTLRYENN